MALFANRLSRTLQAGGAITIAVLTAGLGGFLTGRLDWSLPLVLGIFALICLIVLWAVHAWLERTIMRPLGVAAAIAHRVAEGDLSVSRADLKQVGGGPVTEGLSRMVRELNRLVGSIRSAANDSAALAEEISSSSEQMVSSTQEVAGTTAELTDRAVAQASLVGAVADDAARILAIAEELAAGALKAVERNAALADLARAHRERLGASVRALDRFAEEVELGTQEAEALTEASLELERFIDQARTVAKQTRILALNAAIEAARAGVGAGGGGGGGVESQGFSAVADEVRKLSGQAAAAATATGDTVRAIAGRVASARERLLRLGEGGLLARDAALAAAEGLATVSAEADAVDAWTRGVSKATNEVRGLIDGIAGRTRELATGTEDFAAAAEQISASTEELNASTEEITASALTLANAAVKLTEAVAVFRG
jgi:methyl-accepting chemotaxis protein